MSITKQARIYRLVLPSGTAPFVMPVSGRYVQLVSSPVPITIKAEEMAASDLLPGMGYEFDVGEEFGRLEITKPDGVTAAITVEIWVGHARLIDNRRDNIENPTECIGSGITEIAATTAHSLIPAISLTRIRRKAIIVSNLDVANTLYIRDSDGNDIGAVGPGEKNILPISGPCDVYNPTGAAIACRVGEIYWTR